jgi:hypothetical protein
MKAYFEIVLVMALLFVVGQVSKVICYDREGAASLFQSSNLNERKLRAVSYVRSSDSNPLTSGGSTRFKRTLKDVEKLMLEDELMAMLICEMCEKHACVPQYCRYCRAECDLSSNSKG